MMKVEKLVQLPSDTQVPALGQGTWKMAEQAARRAEEIAALRFGLDLGLTLIDTAEMYADGGAEELVGEAISGRRDDVFIVSKFSPQHATRKGVTAGPEFEVLPWCRSRSIPLMAYSPVEQGRLLPRLQAMADQHSSTPAQIALAWLVRQPDLIAIPKAGTVAHVRENRGALKIELSPADLKALDEAFPPPSRKQPLEML